MAQSGGFFGDGTNLTNIQSTNVVGLPTDLNHFLNNGDAFNGTYRYAHMGDIATISLTPGPAGGK